MKNNIFKNAFHIANHLILWNTPQRKNLLNEELKKESERRLWNDNKLERLIIALLGENGWNEDYNQLAEAEIREIEQLSKELRMFIEKLEEVANKKGELAYNLEREKEKSIKEWIEENSNI